MSKKINKSLVDDHFGETIIKENKNKVKLPTNVILEKDL